MSFQNQGFWMSKDTGCVNDGKVLYDNSSRIEPKRSHQWFMDGPEVELFPNKKQAIEIPNNNQFSGMLNANVPPWGNVPSFQSFSGHFTERLFDSETDTAVNFDDRSMPSVETEKMSLARKVNGELFGNDSSFGLSMSHTLEDPRSSPNYGGFRKVKVSEVKESENVMPLSTRHAYNQGDNDTMLAAHVYKAGDNLASMGLTYKKGDDSFISMRDTYSRAENNFISMGQSFRKGEENISMGQAYKENNNPVSMGETFAHGDNNIISIGQTYSKAEESSMSTGHIYNKEEESSISMGHAYSKGDSSMLSVNHSFNKRESTIISFGGGYDDDDDVNTSGLSSYELLMGLPFQKAEAMDEKELGKLNSNAFVNIPHINSENISKKKVEQKMSKKVPPNNFPSNVRSLLSTGMLDGVPVKYTAWSREKELQGVIKGSGYLCGCQACNFSKVINAYEFERHASCKTKHPNNHIYFENGKTVYGIVQELRSTPQNMLFEVIQRITGSPINQKSFRLWKDSFLAATRELQRIYGKDEAKQFS